MKWNLALELSLQFHQQSLKSNWDRAKPRKEDLFCTNEVFSAMSGWTLWITNSTPLSFILVVAQLLSQDRLFATPWTAARQASLSFTISRSLLKLICTESGTPSNHSILCCPIFLLFSIFSSIRVFSNDLTLPIRWTKYWSFSFSIRPSNEYSGLLSFRIDWFDLLAIQGPLKGLLQHYNLKALIPRWKTI